MKVTISIGGLLKNTIFMFLFTFCLIFTTINSELIYEYCDDKVSCGPGLKCSTKNLCVNQTCKDDVCTYVKCPVVDQCPEGSYKVYTDQCSCCSKCTEYRKIGESCTSENEKCSKGLKCSSGLCEGSCKKDMCNAVFCINQESCGKGEILRLRDTSVCRCCNTCERDEKLKGELYDSCKADTDCGPDLKCSPAVNLCVSVSCADIKNCTVKCGKVKECPNPQTYKHYFACGCCSTCNRYLESGMPCKLGGAKCRPDFECSHQTRLCTGKCNPDSCNLVDCVNITKCPAGQTLIPKDISVCRCCDKCIRKHN